jgi:hypothetical protein
MKSSRIFSIAFFFLTLVLSEGMAQSTARKFALIVAVGDYPRTGGWMDLSSGRDADVLAATLYQLQFDQILLLKDGDATRQKIISAFENQIINQVRPGDVVFFHFSGHGQQISEQISPPNLIEDEFDGLDEALIPVDARDQFQYGVYEGQNHLSDDQIHRLLNKARKKLGPNGQLVFSVDACYSGTINRDAGLVRSRGTTKVFSASEVVSKKIDDPGGGMIETEVTKETGLSPLIVISGARSDEPNYETVDHEGQPIGSLSYALSRTFAKMQPKQSFESFFRQLKYEMKQLAPNQTPQIEGDIDRQVFGSAPLPLLGLQILKFNDAMTPVLQAGTLGDLHPGSKIRLDPLNTNINPIQGTVSNSTLTESIVRLNAPVQDLNPGSWKVVVTEKVSLAIPVRVSVQVQDPALQQAIQQEMSRQQRLQVTNSGAELIVSQSGPGGMVQLAGSNQQVLQQWSSQGQSPSSLANGLVGRIQEYARANYLRNLSNSNYNVAGLNLQVIPVQVEQTYSGQVRMRGQNPPLSAPVVNYPTMNIGSYFIFKVVNTTQTPLFFSIVGVSSNDESYVMVPDDRANVDEFKINPGEELTLSRGEYIFEVAEPRGLDTYIVIGSPTPLDMRPVIRPTRSNVGTREQEFAEMLFGGTRASVPVGQLSVGSVTVQIR